MTRSQAVTIVRSQRWHEEEARLRRLRMRDLERRLSDALRARADTIAVRVQRPRPVAP